MDAQEYRPSPEQYAFTFGGVPPVRSVKPGSVLRLWSDDAFGGKLRTVEDTSAAKVDMRFRLDPADPLCPFKVPSARLRRQTKMTPCSW